MRFVKHYKNCFPFFTFYICNRKANVKRNQSLKHGKQKDDIRSIDS